MGRGFLFTAVAYTRNRIAHGLGNVEYFFALDPEKARGAHLYNLWAALQVAEVTALQQAGVPSPLPAVVRRGFAGRAANLAPYFADPWFDGGNYRATIIVSPHRGTVLSARQMPDLSDDAVVGVVERELELCAYVGPADLQDCAITGRERSAADGYGEAPAGQSPGVIRRILNVEDAPFVDLEPERYRFGKVQLDDRLDLGNRCYAEQIGRQLWPFLEPAGVKTCPSDFVVRHLVVAPACITVWNRRGMMVACTSAGRAEADSLEKQLSEVASVARDVRLFQADVEALLADHPEADTHAMQSQSHRLLQRVINLQLAAAMPENGVLRRFYDATRFDGVLGMLRELSTAVVRYTEAKRAELQTRLLTILGAMFSLLSAWSAVAALASVKLEDFNFQSWSDWKEYPALIIALAFVSLGVLVTLGIALMAPEKLLRQKWQR